MTVTTTTSSGRISSGMRATGKMHLGHYHGVLKNWLELQHKYECFFFVADWHGLTTHYEDSGNIAEHAFDTVVDWLSVGLNPGSCTIFIQSEVLEHAELHLLLSMITPLGWLERVPTYKDQKEKLKHLDLNTYGFLGYPVLQSADVLAYKASYVPVGEDQVAHIELTREIARRFNHLYGKDENYVSNAEAAIIKLGKKSAKLYKNLRTRYLQEGDKEAIATARALLEENSNLSLEDRERLFGYLEGVGKMILPEPEALLSPNAKVPGLDGNKMSKSYNNCIMLREDPDSVAKKIKTMRTDPNRVKLSDPGDPNKCPVWSLHKLYGDKNQLDWVMEGCTNAKIGCLECKAPVIDAINAELKPIQTRVKEYEADKSVVKNIINQGCEKARDEAKATLLEVRRAIGIGI